MFKLFTLITTIFLISGCSYNNEALELASYQNTYTGKTIPHDASSYLNVTDVRNDKTSIGYMEANGQVINKLYSHVDFSSRYQEGLSRALKSAGFNLIPNGADATRKLDVKIKEIQIIYNDTNKFDENLQGKIVVEVTHIKEGKTLMQTFTEKQSKWIKPSYTTKDIEPFFHTLYSSSVNAIASKLADQ